MRRHSLVGHCGSTVDFTTSWTTKADHWRHCSAATIYRIIQVGRTAYRGVAVTTTALLVSVVAKTTCAGGIYGAVGAGLRCGHWRIQTWADQVPPLTKTIVPTVHISL